MRLYELKSSIDWKWDSKTQFKAEASFNVDDKQVRVTLDYLIGTTNPGWLINFHVDGHVGITGRGDAFLIIATVIEIIKDFINTMNPTRIAWASNENEPSRIKLYTRLGKLFQQRGWTITTKSIPGVGLMHIAERTDDTP